MRCALLGSGSAGNATLVQSATTTLLVDCGYSLKAFEDRAQTLGFDPASLTAILVTHEHDDHIGGVGPLARKYSIPVYSSRGTQVADQARGGTVADWHEFSAHAAFTLGDLEIHPVPVPHDAREPTQFIIVHDNARLGILTDLGTATPHVIQQYRACNALVLEFNHDIKLLAESPYPARLKKRIGSVYGHFSNLQARGLLMMMASTQLRRVVAAHLSERTNHPDLVAEQLESWAGVGQIQWAIAAQNTVLPWFDV